MTISLKINPRAMEALTAFKKWRAENPGLARGEVPGSSGDSFEKLRQSSKAYERTFIELTRLGDANAETLLKERGIDPGGIVRLDQAAFDPIIDRKSFLNKVGSKLNDSDLANEVYGLTHTAGAREKKFKEHIQERLIPESGTLLDEYNAIVLLLNEAREKIVNALENFEYPEPLNVLLEIGFGSTVTVDTIIERLEKTDVPGSLTRQAGELIKYLKAYKEKNLPPFHYQAIHALLEQIKTGIIGNVIPLLNKYNDERTRINQLQTAYSQIKEELPSLQDDIKLIEPIAKPAAPAAQPDSFQEYIRRLYYDLEAVPKTKEEIRLMTANKLEVLGLEIGEYLNEGARKMLEEVRSILIQINNEAKINNGKISHLEIRLSEGLPVLATFEELLAAFRRLSQSTSGFQILIKINEIIKEIPQTIERRARIAEELFAAEVEIAKPAEKDVAATPLQAMPTLEMEAPPVEEEQKGLEKTVDELISIALFGEFIIHYEDLLRIAVEDLYKSTVKKRKIWDAFEKLAELGKAWSENQNSENREAYENAIQDIFAWAEIERRNHETLRGLKKTPNHISPPAAPETEKPDEVAKVREPFGLDDNKLEILINGEIPLLMNNLISGINRILNLIPHEAENNNGSLESLNIESFEAAGAESLPIYKNIHELRAGLGKLVHCLSCESEEQSIQIILKIYRQMKSVEEAIIRRVEIRKALVPQPIEVTPAGVRKRLTPVRPYSSDQQLLELTQYVEPVIVKACSGHFSEYDKDMRKAAGVYCIKNLPETRKVFEELEQMAGEHVALRKAFLVLSNKENQEKMEEIDQKVRGALIEIIRIGNEAGKEESDHPDQITNVNFIVGRIEKCYKPKIKLNGDGKYTVEWPSNDYAIDVVEADAWRAKSKTLIEVKSCMTLKWMQTGRIENENERKWVYKILYQLKKYGIAFREGLIKNLEYHINAPSLNEKALKELLDPIPIEYHAKVKIYLYNSVNAKDGELKFDGG